MGLPALVEAAAAHVRHRVEEDPVGEAGGAGGGGGVQLHGGSARTGGKLGTGVLQIHAGAGDLLIRGPENQMHNSLFLGSSSVALHSRLLCSGWMQLASAPGSAALPLARPSRTTPLPVPLFHQTLITVVVNAQF
jgi:hypothetical protein